MPYEVGSIVQGTVTSITNYGAFVKLEDGTIGLVHISEIAKDYVKNVGDYLTVNQLVNAKVISIENEKRVGLSMKAVESDNIQQPEQERSIRPTNRNNYRDRKDRNQDFKPVNESLSFEDRLSRFMKDSEERMQDLKKNFESKRGGGGYRKSAQY